MRESASMKICFLISTLILGTCCSASAVEADGGYAAAFLQMPIGARPTGMGGAYLAISNDAAGALYNPAGLNTLEKPLLGTSYRAMKLDRKLGYATIIFPVRGKSALGIHWLFAGSGSVKARGSSDSGVETFGEISQNSHLFSVLFAKRFTDLVAIGTKLNYLQSGMAGMRAFSVAFDFGATFYLSELINREKRDRFPIQDMQAAVVLKSLAARLPWNTEKYTYKSSEATYAYEQDDKVPTDFGLGISGRLLKRKLILATDILKNDKQHVRFHGGAEYYVTPLFALRTGYGDKRLAAGAGFMFKFGNRALAIDYAFSSDKVDEGSEHIFSFDLLF